VHLSTKYQLEKQMGLVNTELELANPRDGTIKPIKVKSLLDTGSLHLCIPENVAIQ